MRLKLHSSSYKRKLSVDHKWDLSGGKSAGDSREARCQINVPKWTIIFPKETKNRNTTSSLFSQRKRDLILKVKILNLAKLETHFCHLWHIFYIVFVSSWLFVVTWSKWAVDETHIRNATSRCLLCFYCFSEQLTLSVELQKYTCIKLCIMENYFGSKFSLRSY